MNDEFGLPGVEGARNLNPATNGESPVTDEVEFVPETAPPPHRPPGPGLPEALLWTLGIFVTLLAAGAVWTVLFMIVLMLQGYRFNPGSDIDTMMNGLSVNTRVMLLLPSNLLAFIVLIPLGLWRLGRDRFRKLNFSPPSLTQLLIVLAAVYPTTIISTPAFEVANSAWTDFSAGKPWLEAFNEQTSVMKMMEYFGNGSLVLLLFFLAVVPAVGEEFMFRGLLGRGLTARWGVWRGVLMTSVLFALLHTYPPHIAAVLPIGIMMHVVYLTTRSFWAPMLFHFANNAMAATYTALGLVGEEEMQDWMPIAAVAYLIVSIALLYRYRTRYVNDEGEEISPGYVTVAAPPAEIGARRFAPVGWIAAPLFAVVLAATGYLLVSDLAESLDVNPKPAESETVFRTDGFHVRSEALTLCDARSHATSHQPDAPVLTVRVRSLTPCSRIRFESGLRKHATSASTREFAARARHQRMQAGDSTPIVMHSVACAAGYCDSLLSRALSYDGRIIA